ncbi:UDP-glucose 4-epimerase GalE [bacterium]|uniref:UDP-glucose 4-epimerase n=2 Tax=Katanobacteria TaxID=422282 RepID=A0A2M7X3Z7_UNCKA|nr:UDP-glucose 4-epimerase GalE [bacterium]PIP56276.1 MAG: UDP-glucose 4-epimerase GalE [candidate division WWE3 bacterium CG22_combo_CG10-13_8_21_14_all_39_12]PJA40711.1 MAG: UDP-glucose 4-epimerase GalE [candidate division WWE3 bacterium CG_4_9_14_3_um_filter_39_7]
MQRILVTGGAGYIGSITSRLLFNAGYTPIIFDSFANGNEWAIKDFEIIKGDLRNISDISAAISQTKPDAVIHFAALKAAGESMEVPEDYYENNVGGSINLFKAMTEHDVKKIVFSSTAAVYGTPAVFEVHEEYPLKPDNAYGHSKLMVEQTLEWFAKLGKIDSVRLRYFNVAGASPDGSLGEAGKKVLNLIPILMEVAVAKREKFVMYGDDFETPDGTCIRDYIHVMDLAKAHLVALKKLSEFEGTEYYNVGVGKGYSVQEVVAAVKRVSDVDFKVEIGPRRVGDPAAYFADNSKISNELGWFPEFTLEDIVNHAWAWEKGGKLNHS